MSNDNNVMKFICPLLAALAVVVALFGPWFTMTSATGRNLESTLLDVLQGNAFVEYSSTRWLWISGLGVVLVLASAVVGDQVRKRLAEAGSFLMIILPGWSLFNVYTGDEDFTAGWAMWAVAVITVAVVILARMIPQEEPTEFVTPQAEQQ